jgi:hypothetical protein
LKTNISNGDNMTSETKISKGFQTVVPSDIRKMFDVGAWRHFRMETY